MKLSDAYEIYKIVKGVAHLAYLLGFGIGKMTKKKPPKRALRIYTDTIKKTS